MKVLLLVASVCLGAAMADVDTSTCRVITGDPSFSFETYISEQYKFEAGTASSDVKNWYSAYLSHIRVNDNYYSIYTVNQKDFSQLNFDYLILSQEGSQMTRAALVDGQQSDNQLLGTVYGYKDNAYVQVYVCGEKTPTGDDVRQVFSFGAYKLTKEDWKQIALNDKKNGFTGSLVKIGNGARIADDDE